MVLCEDQHNFHFEIPTPSMVNLTKMLHRGYIFQTELIAQLASNHFNASVKGVSFIFSDVYLACIFLNKKNTFSLSQLVTAKMYFAQIEHVVILYTYLGAIAKYKISLNF